MNGDIFGEGFPDPDPFEEIFGPFGQGGPFGYPPDDPFRDGFEPPWGWGPEGPVYSPDEPPTGWGPDGPYWGGNGPATPPEPPIEPPPIEPPPVEPPPVEPPPAAGGGAAGAITAATWAAIALLVVEVVSISNAVITITDKEELQSMVDNLNQIRDRAVQLHQWTDALQQQWAKANEALARKAEQLQKDLENTWIGWLIY